MVCRCPPCANFAHWAKSGPTYGMISDTFQLAQLAFELAFERLTAVRDWRRLMRKSIPRCAKSSVIVEQ